MYIFSNFCRDFKEKIFYSSVYGGHDLDMNPLGNLAKNLSMNRGRREPSSSLALGKKATFRAPPLSVSSFTRIKKRF